MIDDHQPIVKPDRLPPIRILDILVLTTTMAFVFMIQEQFERAQGAPILPAALKYGAKLVYATHSGIALAAIYWLILQKRITGKFFQQPGHWILASNAISQTTMLIVWFLFSAEGDDLSDQGFPSVLFCSFFLAELLSSAILILATFKIRGIWRWVTGLLSVASLATALTFLATAFFFRTTGPSSIAISISSFFGAVATIAGALNVFFVLFAINTDRKTRTSRDWLHWISLIVFFSQSIAQPIFSYLYTHYANLNLQAN